MNKTGLLALKRCKQTYYNSSVHGNSVELIITTVSYRSPWNLVKTNRPGEEGGVSSPDEGIYETNFIWSISIRWFQKSMLYGRNRYHRASISCLNLVFDGKLTYREIGNLMGSNQLLAADNENWGHKVQFGTYEPRFEDQTSFSCRDLVFPWNF